jgi:sugar lactone lactonase YvrE
MKRQLVVLAVMALFALLAVPSLAAATSLQPTVLTTWEPAPWGSFAESMASDSHGDLYVSRTTWGYYDRYTMDDNTAEVWKVAADGSRTLVATEPVSPFAMVTGIAIDNDDQVYVAIFDYSNAYGIYDSPSGVFKVGEGRLTRVLSLPPGTFPNGLAFHKGKLYISDCERGAIWRVRVGEGAADPAAPWFMSALLAPPNSYAIGANGIAFKGDTLYAVVSSSGRILKVPVRYDGTAGEAVVLCKHPELRTADGIAFDMLGRLWVVTNGSKLTPDGGLWRVALDGSLRMIANDPGWLNYPVMPVFGRTCSTATTLYVLNGAYYDYLDGSAPDLISLPVGVAGLPLR